MKPYLRISLSKFFIIFFIIFTIITLFSSQLEAKRKSETAVKDNKFEFGFSFANTTGDGFYDESGELLSQRDIDNPLGDTTSKLSEIFSFSEQSYKFNFRYNFNEKIHIFLNTALLSQDLTQKVKFYDESTGQSLDFKLLDSNYRKKRENKSNLFFKYVNIGTKYSVFDSIFLLNIDAGVKLPIFIHKGLFDDRCQQFLSGGAYQVYTGLELGYQGEDNSFLLGAKFNFRDEEYSNQMIYNFKYILNRIEAVQLIVNVLYYQSLDDYPDFGKYPKLYLDKDLKLFDPRYEVAINNYYYIDIASNLNITPRIDLQIKMGLVIIGENMMNTKTFGVGFSYKL